MPVKTFFRTLRIISTVVLFFFCWSFLPLYAAVAYAATDDRKASGVRGEGKAQPRTQTTGERFEKTLEAIREKIEKAEEKAGKNQDITAEVAEVKAKRAEIESLDLELRREFRATEKKLKDAGLPQEILGRHYKFVKHYEDNLTELKNNLGEVEQYTVDSKQGKEALRRAKLHLEKTKTPSKHVPLDPNNLPFRARKAAKPIPPRLKKEQFEKDFPPQRSQSSQRTAGLLDTDQGGWTRILDSALRTRRSTLEQKPLLLAYNGLASDMPLELPRPSEGEGWGLPSNALIGGEGRFELPAFVFSELNPRSALATPNLMVAQATGDLPAADDLAETPEVQFTQDIRDLAAQLGNKPTKIFEWVRNNVEFVPSYGSIQGADMCLQSRQCNAMDTASLLIALLRVSNYPARYAYGTVEIPIEKIKNWVGGFTDPTAALTLMASGGIPVTAGISGGVITKARLEHVWVETYIPYGNYRGAIMDDSIKTWIPMDDSFKQYTYTNGFDITSTVPFDQNAYMSQVQSQNAVHYYQSKIQEYLDVNMPDTSIVDVKGYREITQETYHFLPSTLPYKTVAWLGTFSAAPSNIAAKVTFTLTDTATGAAVSYTGSTPELAGKRITVSYIPATANDEALIASHGSYLYDVPAYMLNLKPVLRIEGVAKLTGEATTLGSEQALTMQFIQPGGNNETVNKKLIAGAYYAIGTDLQGINENVPGKRNYKLNTNVLSETAGTLGNDDLIGEHLFILATTYHYANDKIYKSGAKLFNTAMMRSLSEGITSFTLSVSHLFSMPKSATPSGVNMDVAMDRLVVVAKDGNVQKEKSFMDIAGLVSSYHEHDIFERIDGFASVSAVRALQVASTSGIPIQKVNASNISEMLPILQVGTEIKADVQNAVNTGKEVTIPQTNVSINDWIGVGYIVKDPVTSSGTYMITGGLAGSDSTKKDDGMQVVEIFKDAYGWIKNQWDLLTRSNIAYAAELSADEILQGTLVDNALLPLGTKYKNIDCSMLVRVAYAFAGICLDSTSATVSSVCTVGNDLATKYGITTGKGVEIFYAIAMKQQIRGSVRKDKPLIGDMIFFNNTYDPNKDCVANHDNTHVGIVQALNQDANGTMAFIHSSTSKGVVERRRLNIAPDYNTNPKYNTWLRAEYPPCKQCDIWEICLGSINPDCSSGSQPACSNNVWNQASPSYSGQLFNGFGTVRSNVILTLPSH